MKKHSISPHEKKVKKAFTLIELLVVIAIIAILAAILFPVFARARENARRASCLSNMKQIGLGVMQYTQDYDELFPNRTRIYATTPSTTYINWAENIQPYVKSYQLFKCPSISSTDSMNDSPNDRMPASYACNSTEVGGQMMGMCANFGAPPVALARMQNSAQFIIVMETTERNENMNIVNQDWLRVQHLTTSIYLFGDGHAKALKPFATTDAAAGGSSPLNMWTIDSSSYSGGDATGAKTNLANAVARGK